METWREAGSEDGAAGRRIKRSGVVGGWVRVAGDSGFELTGEASKPTRASMRVIPETE